MKIILNFWRNFKLTHPGVAQFLIFFMLSNGITILQMLMMPILKSFFDTTALADVRFQVGHIGTNFDGSPYYIFNYAAGRIADGGGGGLAYFLAVQLSMAIAQVINFFLQRKVTFKSQSNIAKAARWYVFAYILITIGAAAAQGFYKAPIYQLFINTWAMGRFGETLADILTMLINCIISFWVFYPILKIIFKDKVEDTNVQGGERL